MRFIITLLQLETFSAVVESGSTVEAARRLYTSQSSISKTLTRLEENLGFSLFARQHGKMELTDAGEMFAGSVRSLLDGLEDGIRDARLMAQSAQPDLRIAASTYLAHDLIKEYVKLHPTAYLNLQLYPEQHLKQMLANREVNLILSTDPSSFSSSIYKWVPLMSCEVLVVIPTGHPLAQEERISLRALEKESFVCNNIGLNADFLRRMFHRNHCYIKHLLECNDDRVFTDYLDQHERLTFLPAYALITTPRQPAIRERRIEGSHPRQQYGFVYLHDAPPPAELMDFIERAQDYCADLERKIQAFFEAEN